MNDQHVSRKGDGSGLADEWRGGSGGKIDDDGYEEAGGSWSLGADVRGRGAPTAAIVERKTQKPGRIGTETARKTAFAAQESTRTITVSEKRAGIGPGWRGHGAGIVIPYGPFSLKGSPAGRNS
jgi:hypothetical protein